MLDPHAFFTNSKRLRRNAPRLLATILLVSLSIVGFVANVAAAAVGEQHFWSWATLTTLLSGLMTAIVGVISYRGIPPTDDERAQAQIELAIALYPVLMDASGPHRNAWFRRVHELCEHTNYNAEKIIEFLQSKVEGQRMAAIGVVQWAWPLHAFKEGAACDADKPQNSRPSEHDPQKKALDKARKMILAKLLKIIECPPRPFEEFQALRAVWGMAGSLDAADKGDVLKAVQVHDKQKRKEKRSTGQSIGFDSSLR